MKNSLTLICILFCLSISSLAYAYSIESEKFDYLPQTVVFKIKAEYKHLISLESQNRTGIDAIDTKLLQLGTNQLKPRFKTNPKLYKSNMPDLSLIFQAGYSKAYFPGTAAEILSQCNMIEYAEPIPLDYAFATPNDPQYVLSTYLTTMQADLAWDIHKGENGTEPILIAITDTGVSWRHADLVDNINRNLGEDYDGDGSTIFFNGTSWSYDAGDLNGIDDDENGYIDDLIGWDFMVDMYGNQSYDPNEGPAHGTYVAGIADAKTNNALYGASLPWNVSLMPISCSYTGSSTIYRGYDAIVYAAENGADIINCSWGDAVWCQANEDAVAYAYSLGSIILAAAGNSNNTTPVYPAAYPKVIAVAAVNNAGVKSSVSSYGAFIDVSAPVEGMYSLGVSLTATTSRAAPVGSGLSALILSAHPTWTQEQVMTQLIATCDNIDASNPGKENMLGDGRLNAYNALSMVSPSVDGDLRIGLFEVLPPNDANANSAVEQNEQFYLSLKIRNYTHGVSSDDVTFTLSTTDTSITILDNTCTSFLPEDGYTTLINAFSCYVSPSATSHYVTFTLTTSADEPIAVGSTQTFKVLINAGGAFIWEGKYGRDYSGTYIKNWHATNGYPYVYGTEFPASFHTFSSVYLSFGAVGSSETRFNTIQMYNAVKNYLLEGGRIYIEGTDALGFDIVHCLPDVEGSLDGYEVLWPLLGIAFAEDGFTNVIDGLTGQGPAVSNGIAFTASNQVKKDGIDIYTPDNSAATAFEESGYGNVSVQNYGSHGQKSFVFSYILAELVDGTAPNTRSDLLSRIRSDFLTPEDTMFMQIPEISIVQEGVNVILNWDAVLYADSYVIESSDLPDTDFTPIGTTQMTTWTGVSAPHKFYRVISSSNP